MVGDEFDQTTAPRAKGVCDAFYWILAFGSFFASLLMPIFLRSDGASVGTAFPAG